jgi:hypothetical protein
MENGNLDQTSERNPDRLPADEPNRTNQVRSTTEKKPQAQEGKIPTQNEKMDIPVPHRPGSEIIIGPEGPYSTSFIGASDSDAR